MRAQTRTHAHTIYVFKIILQYLLIIKKKQNIFKIMYILLIIKLNKN